MQRYPNAEDIRTWHTLLGSSWQEDKKQAGRKESTSAYLFLKAPRIDWIRVIAQAPRAAKTTFVSFEAIETAAKSDGTPRRQDVMNQAEP
jgi:hypothetical protein